MKESMNITDRDICNMMDNLIVAYLSGEVTPEEERQVLEYLSSDSNRLKEYLDIVEILLHRDKANTIG